MTGVQTCALPICRRLNPEKAQSRCRIVLGFLLRNQHPREHPAMAAARGTPAARRIEREVLRIELRKRFARLDVGARGRKPRENLAAFGEQKARALAEPECAVEGGRRCVRRDGCCRWAPCPLGTTSPVSRHPTPPATPVPPPGRSGCARRTVPGRAAPGFRTIHVRAVNSRTGQPNANEVRNAARSRSQEQVEGPRLPRQ